MDKIKVVRFCQAQDKKELIHEVNTFDSCKIFSNEEWLEGLSIVDLATYNSNLKGVCVGVVGENIEFLNVSKEYIIKCGYNILDSKNYRRPFYVKAIWDNWIALYYIDNKENFHTKQLNLWTFDIDIKDIDGYCGTVCGNNDLFCDGVVIKQGAKINNIKCIDKTILTNSGNLLNDYTYLLSLLVHDKTILKKYHEQDYFNKNLDEDIETRKLSLIILLIDKAINKLNTLIKVIA